MDEEEECVVLVRVGHGGKYDPCMCSPALADATDEPDDKETEPVEVEETDVKGKGEALVANPCPKTLCCCFCRLCPTFCDDAPDDEDIDSLEVVEKAR